MNDSVLDRLALDNTLISGEGNVVPASDTLSIKIELGLNCVPRILLGVELGRRIALEASKSHNITWLRALGRNKEFDNTLVWSLSAEDHSVAHVVCQFSSLEIHQDDAESILHVLDRDKLLEAAGNRSYFSVSNINFLIVEVLTVRIFPHFDYLSNANVHLSDVW